MKDIISDEVYLKFIERFGKIYDFQIKVWEEISKKEDVLIIAPTGYGKTYAATLPIFSKIKETDKKGIKVLYITPLKALNRDIFKQLASFADSLDLNMDIRHGDTTAHVKRLQTLMPPDILVTTPETLQGILIGKKLREHIKEVKYVIVDEIHELFTSKRGSQLSVALQRLEEITNFQRIGISATIGDQNQIAYFLSGKNKKANIIKVEDKKGYNVNIIKPDISDKINQIADELLITKNSAFNLSKIKDLTKIYKKILVFVNTREMAELLGVRLDKIGLKVGVHHSSLSKSKRIEVEEDFKKGELNLLVATSSLELGIDIGEIEMVVQYSSPRQATKLVQRVGRAGHKKDLTSNGIVFVQDLDDEFESEAILQRVKEDWLEKPNMPIKPYDVLAHQIIGFLIMEKRKAKDIFEIIKKSYVYHNLTIKEFEDVLNLMKSVSLIYEYEGFLIRTRKGFMHYFNSISMIPDEKNFIVKDMELNKAVGVLHQGFVIKNCDIGNTITMQGVPWLITDVKGNIIEVIRNNKVEGAIPSWEGELIPVEEGIATLAAQKRKEYHKKELPNKNLILIEREKEAIVINSTFGSKINEALAKLVGALITTKIGSSVNIKTDPYRIIILLPKGSDFKVDKKMFDEIPPKGVDYMLKTAIKNSSQYIYAFYRVSKRFGVISKEAQFSQSYLRRMAKSFDGTILEKETFNEIFREKMDVGGLIKLLSKIKNGDIQIKTKKGLSTTSLDGIKKSSFGGFIKPEIVYAEIIDLVDKRLRRRRLYFVCTHCKNSLGSFRVNNIPQNFKCPICRAKTIGFVGEKERDKIKKYSKGKENRDIEERGEVFLNYGKEGCYVLAAYGIGPRKAKQILKRKYKNQKDFIMEIIKAEREFIKNKRFWT